ncbi:DUF1445 domain protein [Aspergillus homomorphus CBS 101889]|uniref:DUF1445-domain-containing protein n=1 Tax=Aspergillus homomorphus (strain CBS 101889) TaxID=1450537 RepID=A0A395HY89_ASPHC|nr:DUF1445-domain-containing protein [Aspergillus homomorphus CBS 101889]RAL11214.1 DUF1445-domain-containing protein [Aspergillus homomorphus CBS 101889]
MTKNNLPSNTSRQPNNPITEISITILPSHQVRLSSRQNLITNTAGLAPGYLQANLLILPAKHSQDFHDLCLRNPVACPLLGIAPIPGNPHLIQPEGCITTSEDFDIRTDCPLYRVYKHGQVIGCSYSFEPALSTASLPRRHQTTKTLVPMYRTRIPLHPAVIFTGGYTVFSMRPYPADQVERNLDTPDFGDRCVVEKEEVSVFWACGVTPQLAVEAAGDKIEGLVFAPEPGHMLVTDWREEGLLRLRGRIGSLSL